MVEAQRAAAVQRLEFLIDALDARHRGAQFQRRSAAVEGVQRARLIGGVDELRWQPPAAGEEDFRLLQILLVIGPQAGSDAGRRRANVTRSPWRANTSRMRSVMPGVGPLSKVRLRRPVIAGLARRRGCSPAASREIPPPSRSDCCEAFNSPSHEFAQKIPTPSAAASPTFVRRLHRVPALVIQGRRNRVV
jgi:hypothetical protein